MLLRVVRTLKKGETLLVGDPTGGLADKMPRAERRKMTSKFSSTEARRLGLTSPEVSYPAIIGTAIAIYR